MTAAKTEFSEEVLRHRKKSIGASECASALGVQGAFKTPYQVWLDKTSPEALTNVDNVYTRRGTILEAYVIFASEMKWGQSIRRNRTQVALERKEFLTCTPDGWYVKPKSEGIHYTDVLQDPDLNLVQIKTSSENQESGYGPDDTPEVPLNYLFQCYHEMLVTGAQSVDLIVYFANEGEFDAVIFMTENMEPENVALYIRNCNLRRFHIKRNDERLLRLEELLTDFWEFVTTKTPPKKLKSAKDFVFNKTEPELIEVVGQEAEIARNYLETKADLENAEAAHSECKIEIKSRLSEKIIWLADGYKFTHTRNKPRSNIAWQALAKHSYIDKNSVKECISLVREADIPERERLAILRGLEENNLTPALEDRFVKAIKKKDADENSIKVFTVLAQNCRIPLEVEALYTSYYPGAQVLRARKQKEEENVS